MLSTDDISSKQLALAARGFRLLALNGDNEARSNAVALEAKLRNRFMDIDFDGNADASFELSKAPSAAQTGVNLEYATGSNRMLDDLLSTMRKLLDMDIAFVSEFVDGHGVIRHRESHPDSMDILPVGRSCALKQSYCKRVVDGHFPNAIPDTAQLPEALSLPATAELNIGSYISVPVVMRNGEIFGTLCCISHTPRTALGNRQIDALRKVAEMVATELERQRS